VKWEINVCFYIELKKLSGHPFHLSHSKFIDLNLVAFPTHLLTSDQIDNIVHVVNATSNNRSACNYIHGKFGKFISLMKAAYLCRRGNGDLNSPRDDIDQMMDNMAKSDEIFFVSLSDEPIKDFFDVNSTVCDVTTITMSTTKSFTGHVHYEPISESSAISSLATQINEERSERNLQKKEALFIALAWIVKPAFRLFKLCPEVVWLNVTSHSNNKGCHLLTFSSRLSIGKQIVWMWIFIPNQQRFSFRWVFKEALPKLVPEWLMERVLFFMKDGDPQQCNEILLAMKRVFVNASEGTCGFHVLHMGWRSNVPSCVNVLSAPKLRMWSFIIQQVHKWLYSWMTPGNVEDEEEYEISKYLLEKFICLQTVLEVVGEHWFLVYKVIKFLRGHVYT
jgi:hypothetical protein